MLSLNETQDLRPRGQRPFVMLRRIAWCANWSDIAQHMGAPRRNAFNVIDSSARATANPAAIIPIRKFSFDLIDSEWDDPVPGQAGTTDSAVDSSVFTDTFWVAVGIVLNPSSLTVVILRSSRVLSSPWPNIFTRFIRSFDSLVLRIGRPFRAVSTHLVAVRGLPLRSIVSLVFACGFLIFWPLTVFSLVQPVVFFVLRSLAVFSFVRQESLPVAEIVGCLILLPAVTAPRTIAVLAQRAFIEFAERFGLSAGIASLHHRHCTDTYRRAASP